MHFETNSSLHIYMVSRTREKLIEVARQLFMKKGVENTTMNDIAAASEKGRRTIYTYFKNKKEIYNAVVEQQSEQLVSELRGVSLSDLPPADKLEAYLRLRFMFVDKLNPKSERGRYFFLRDHRRMDRVHKLALGKEFHIMYAIVAEGVQKGVFDAEQARRLPSLVALLSQGVDHTSSRDAATEIVPATTNVQDDVVEFIMHALLITDNRQ